MATENNHIDPNPINSEIKSIFRKIDLFSGLSDEQIDSVAGAFNHKTYKLGETIAEKGEKSNRLYYIYKGEVRKKDYIDNQVQSLGKFREGEFFGEISLIDELKWEYTLSSADPELIVIYADTDNESLKKIIPDIKEKIAYYQLFKKLRDTLGTSSTTDEQVHLLTQNVFIEKHLKGEYVFHQAENNTSLYFILSGQIDLYREKLDAKALVGLAKANDFIGEYGVVTRASQGYDAKVSDDAVLIEIPLSTVQLIFNFNPDFSEILQKKINAYESELAKFQSGGTSDDRDIFPEFKKTGEKKIRRFPWMHQHDESDCGAACLTMISKYYGVKLSMGQVREMANVNVEGATMGAVCRAAENLGYRAHPYKLAYSGLKDINLPAIVHWEGYHWIVLFKVNQKYVWLADPALGIRKLTHSQFRQSWTGYAIELDATPKLKENIPGKNSIYRFLEYLKPYKFYFFEIFIGALILNILGLASPLFIQSIIDNVIVYKNISLLNMMLFGMVMVIFFQTLTSSIQQLVMIYVTTRMDLKLLADFYKHVLSLPMKFFYSRKTGDIITRFGENSKVRALLSNSMISTVLNMIMVVVYISMMLAYSVELSIVVLAFIPLFIAMTLIFTPIIKNISNEIFKTNSDQSSVMIESIQGIETIKANSVEWTVRTKWEDSYVQNVNQSAKMQKIQMTAGIISRAITTVSSISVLWYGSHLVMEGAMSLGEFMGFNAIIGSVMAPIMGIVGLYDQFQAVTTSMDRLNDVLQIKPEVDETPNEKNPKVFVKKVKGDVSFENISFRYGSEDSPLVINGLNLEVKAGQTVALTGKSGCGKSTLMKMIAGFNIPTGGSLKIDGTDITNTDLYSLRGKIGWVLQDSFLFSGDVIENIALGDTNPDINNVIKAAKLAAADEFIKDFPMGYKTMIGEKGMAVSGGQRQRICIARALYRDPQILLMDEATSSLDADSEKRIQEALDRILVGRTAVIIAHRLSTVRNADVICYMDKGRIVEKGTHDELIKAKGLYYQMATEQIGGSD
jgi:subfamily B ATP-binding cassette protein HlyB/CyaB